MEQIISKLNDGGPFFMYPILILLVIIIGLIIYGIVKRGNLQKTISLIASIAWFTIAWGAFGQAIGLISAFDTIEAVGNTSPAIVAGGLKIALLTTVFGVFTFMVARAGIVILVILDKSKVADRN